MPCKSLIELLCDRIFKDSGAAVADDVYPGTKHNCASVSNLSLLKKMENKLIVPIHFETRTSKFCFKIISFLSLESELHFNSEDSQINFDRACSPSVNSLLRALRAICNISSHVRQDVFMDKLLVY